MDSDTLSRLTALAEKGEFVLSFTSRVAFVRSCQLGSESVQGGERGGGTLSLLRLWGAEMDRAGFACSCKLLYRLLLSDRSLVEEEEEGAERELAPSFPSRSLD